MLSSPWRSRINETMVKKATEAYVKSATVPLMSTAHISKNGNGELSRVFYLTVISAKFLFSDITNKIIFALKLHLSMTASLPISVSFLSNWVMFIHSLTRLGEPIHQKQFGAQIGGAGWKAVFLEEFSRFLFFPILLVILQMLTL